MELISLAADNALLQRWDLRREHLYRLGARLEQAREDTLSDVRRWSPEAADLDPLFLPWPEERLQEHRHDPADSLLTQIRQIAQGLADEVENVVVLGIGGSYMGARALMEACCDPYYNLLPRDRRGGPRLFFEGNNVDNDSTRALLEYLHQQGEPWGIVVISKSGTTLETAVAFRVFLEALQHACGHHAATVAKRVVAVTGRSGALRRLADQLQCPVLDVPEGIGGRFSVLTPVGLLPAALLGLDLVPLLEGAAAVNHHFRQMPVGENLVLDYAGLCHLWEVRWGLTVRVLASWCKQLEALGFWYDQLLSESLGKEGQGATPVTAVNTRDLHSRGQQHQQGRRDKLITNLVLRRWRREPVLVPQLEDDPDGLNWLAGRELEQLMQAAVRGTNQAYRHDDRPTLDLLLPQVDEAVLGQLFQMMMLATVVEGKLIDVNPYGQPGVKLYKENMQRILRSET